MIAGIVCLIIGVVFLWATYSSWRRGRHDVLKWPTARGRIVNRTVRVPTNRVGHSGLVRWEPAVRFSYEVGGREYEGDRIFIPWPPMDTKKRAEAFLKTIPDDVAVRYNPGDPSQSALFPAPLWWTLLGLLGFIFALGVGFIFVVTSTGRP